MRENVIAIVPAAGLGKRLGSGINKPFCALLNKPLIVWALYVLEQTEEISEIIPVVKESDMEEAVKVFERHGFLKIKRIAPGGRERQDSVYHGLKLVDGKGDIVLIHDAARPMIDPQSVRDVIAALDGFDGAVVGVPVKDTIKEVETRPETGNAGKHPKDDVLQQEVYEVRRTLKRESLWAVQTPQVFRRQVIMRAYEKAIAEGFYATDDSALVERYDGKVRVVRGSYDNIKITTKEDMAVAEQLLKKRLKDE